MLYLKEFIKNNPLFWEESLSNEPYHLNIKREDGYCIFNYNQIKSDFSNPIVCEARGIILDELDGFKVVCRGFDKFFNFGETHAASLDWTSAKITEKIDGSIIKLWFSERLNRIMWSTNGTIYAERCPVMFPNDEIKTFGDMINKAIETDNRFTSFFENYNSDCTYIFEVVGPNNRVVIPYEEIKLYLLAARYNITGKYFSIESIDLLKPKEYSQNFYYISDIEDFLKLENMNTYKHEGVVVSDYSGNRIKIKTQEYLRIHRLRGEAVPTDKRMMDLILNNETSEFLTYFPEYKEQYDRLKKLYDSYLLKLDCLKHEFKNKTFESRKDLALWAKTTISPNFIFALADGKIDSSNNWCMTMGAEKLVELMK